MNREADILRPAPVCKIALLCLLIAPFASDRGVKVSAASEQSHTRERVFNLEEVSAFEIAGQRPQFAGGHRAECGYEPEADVNTYPTFSSEEPIYGSVWLGSEYGDRKSGTRYRFAIDESGGTSAGYDRLHFDLNRNLNLRDDAVLVPKANLPPGAELTYGWIEQQVCFDYLDVPLEFGDTGLRPLELTPRLTISDKGYVSLNFVTTTARKGQIEIADRAYDVFLGHNHVIGGWFDRPSTALRLVPSDKPERVAHWWGADRLMAMHVIDGKHYRFSATPAGDKLIVRPYEGEFGTFKIGSGWRVARRLKMIGSLRSRDAAVAVRQHSEDGRFLESHSCRLPSGDYLPSYLTVWLGAMRIGISENYHSDGKGRDRAGRPQVYGITIRENKPFVLDFSNKPEVMFASPAENQRIRLGDDLTVRAVLTDPKLDIMIRDLDAKPIAATSEVLGIPAVIALAGLACLWLLSRRLRVRRRLWLSVAAVTIVLAVAATTGAYFVLVDAVNARLDYDEIVPQVIVRRADGSKVAGGRMPFG
jgi:hypothetical protein